MTWLEFLFLFIVRSAMTVAHGAVWQDHRQSAIALKHSTEHEPLHTYASDLHLELEDPSAGFTVMRITQRR